MIGGLHQRGAERELDRLPVLERQVPDGLGRVGLLGDRDRQAGLAQLGDEAVRTSSMAVNAGSNRCRRSGSGAGSELFRRDLDVRPVLEQDVQGGTGGLGVDALDPEQHEGPGPVDGLGDGGMLLEVERTQRTDDAGDLSASSSVMPGTLASTIARSRSSDG